MTKDDILAIARHLLGLVGGYIVSHGFADSDTAQQLSGGVLAIIAIGWSLWQKRRPSAAMIDRAAAAQGAVVVSSVDGPK